MKETINHRPQDVGDSRVIGYLLRKATNREWNQPMKKYYGAVNKGERIVDQNNVLTSGMEM